MTSPDAHTGPTLHRLDGQPLRPGRQIELDIDTMWLSGTVVPSPRDGQTVALSVTTRRGQTVMLLPEGAIMRARTATPTPSQKLTRIEMALTGLVCAEDWSEDDLQAFAPMTTAIRDLMAATRPSGGGTQAAHDAACRALNALTFQDPDGEPTYCFQTGPLLRGQKIKVALEEHWLYGIAVPWPLEPDRAALRVSTPAGHAVMLLPHDTDVYDDKGDLQPENALHYLGVALDQLLSIEGWDYQDPLELDPMIDIVRALLAATTHRAENSSALARARAVAQEALHFVEPVIF